MRKRNVKITKSCKRVTALVLACALASSTAGVPVWEVRAMDRTGVEVTLDEELSEDSLSENCVLENNELESNPWR